MWVHLLFLQNMPLTFPPSHHALPQSTISVSQVFILLVTFFLIHHIFWVNVAHLPSVAKHRSSLQILFTKKYSPLLVNQVEYIGLPDILLVLDTRIEGMYQVKKRIPSVVSFCGIAMPGLHLYLYLLCLLLFLLKFSIISILLNLVQRTQRITVIF